MTRGPAHGVVHGDAWMKKVRKSAHMLRKPPAWCVDLADLEAAEALGATMLRLSDLENSIVYEAALDVLRRRGFPIDRGWGAQLALPLGYWRTGPESKPEPAGTVQLSFLEGRR